MARVKPARQKAYGVQVRKGLGGAWLWVRVGGAPTVEAREGTEWPGPTGADDAHHAALFMSSKLPGVTFRVSRKPVRSK